LTLLVLRFIGAVVMQDVVRCKVLRAFDGFIAKWIAGFLADDVSRVEGNHSQRETGSRLCTAA
jgi:hypothetical protein